MRLLSIHPKYLDKQSLFTLWREGLAAQKSLAEPQIDTKPNHSLQIFQHSNNPQKAIGSYLSFIASEGSSRGYKLHHEKILIPNFEEGFLNADNRQIIFEIDYLKSRLKIRDKPRFREIKKVSGIELNPIFKTFN